MPEEIKKISVVIPVYNSSPVLRDLCETLGKVFAVINTSYQLVLVDDCSQDNSWEVIKEIKKTNTKNVTAIRMAKNFSQHNAIFCGLRYCTGNLIVTMDDDMQHPADEIPVLITHQTETNADVVYGITNRYKRAAIRNVFDSGYKTTLRMSSKRLVTKGSSFRVIKKELVKKLITHNQQFVFIDELISWYTTRIEYANVRHEATKLSRSRYSGLRLAQLYFNLVFSYNATLLKLITYIGLSASLVSFLVGTFFIMKKIFFHVRIGFTGIIVSITFTGGVILLSIGILGEYMRRMYNNLNQRPQYSISEILE